MGKTSSDPHRARHPVISVSSSLSHSSSSVYRVCLTTPRSTPSRLPLPPSGSVWAAEVQAANLKHEIQIRSLLRPVIAQRNTVIERLGGARMGRSFETQRLVPTRPAAQQLQSAHGGYGGSYDDCGPATGISSLDNGSSRDYGATLGARAKDSPREVRPEMASPWSTSVSVAVSVTVSNKLSNWQTFYHLLSFITGTGMLCLPLALVEIDWYGVLLLVAAAAVSAYTSKLLVEALEAVRWLRGTSVSYSDLGHECFGEAGKVATSLLVHASFLILSTGYLALASSCLVEVMGLQYGTVMVLVTVCVWFQVLVPSLKALALFSAVNVAFSFWIEAVILGDAMYPLKQIALDDSAFVFVTPDLSGVPLIGKLSYTFSLLLGGLFCHSLVPTLYDAMADARQCSSVVARSTLGVTALLYLPICCVTYAVYGATLQAPVFFNMRNAVVRNLAIVLYSIHLLLSYMVTLYPLQRAFERWIVHTPGSSNRSNPTEGGAGGLPFVNSSATEGGEQERSGGGVETTVRVLCRSILVLTTLFLGYFSAPSTLDVFAWMLVPIALLALVLPCVFYWQLCGEDATSADRAAAAAIAVLAIVTTGCSLAVVVE